MFSLMLHKLTHKKWMVLCLLIGNILLISVASSYPLYRVSSFQRMLTDEFDTYIEEENCYPAIFEADYNTLKRGTKMTMAEVEEKAGNALEQLNVNVFDTVISYSLGNQRAKAAVVRDNNKAKRMTLTGVSGMQEKVEILYGRYPSDELDSEGFMEVMVSNDAMVDQDILLDDEYGFDLWKLENGKQLNIKVVGVFRPIDKTDAYWEKELDELDERIYTTYDAFKNYLLFDGAEEKYTIYGQWLYMWDYESLDVANVSSLMHSMENIEKDKTLKSLCSENGFMQVLEDYSAKAKRIEATLLILQVPVLFLLCAFLYMIAGQMLQMEQNEISLMRSRGASKGQVVLLYLMQSIFLSVLSLLGGIPLGAAFCKLLGASTAFLEFSATRELEVRFTGDVIIYVVGAVLLSVVMTTLPVISYSGLSIVNMKRSRSRKKKSLWKRLYLDVILIAISLYGYYSFKRSADQMVEDVMTGNSLDPLLYVSFSLFILGVGLFFARIQPILLKVFFGLFKNFMKPSTYTSMLSSIRTSAKQEFIIVFLILTVSIGISDTTIARTIVLNAVNNTKHIVGADMVVKETWKSSKNYDSDNEKDVTYTEPDFDKYKTISGVNQLTQVTVAEGVRIGGEKGIEATVMGIKAQGFYQVTDMETGLLPFSYEEYLNALAVDSQAILVSENFMIKQGYKLGDTLMYENERGDRGMGTICGFFNYWPSYKAESYLVNDKGELETQDEYLIVANQTYLREQWGVYPYEIWMDVNDDGEGFYSWTEGQKNLTLTKLEDMSQKEEEIRQDTIFQGTNGILSMSFIVILVLCCVGYLIYWIMSIRSRELLFGVLRAMGMRKREITWLLTVEQICSGLFAIVAGAFTGILASRMFVPMIQQAYAATEQILPLKLITNDSDMVQLFAVIAIMLCVCLLILGRIVSKMNISSALKLGED